MNIENRMRSVMEKKGITEEVLAERIGMSQAQVNRLKNGKRVPRIDVAYAIARALNVPIWRIWSLNDKTAA